MRTLFFLLLLIGLVACRPKPQSAQSAYVHPSVKTKLVSTGGVTCANPYAAEAGNSILKAGGNAIDAAVTTQFALAVTFPLGGNIGGGGFMVIRWHDGQTQALDYREMAPSGASRDMYLDDFGNVLDSVSRYGGLASGVPGSVAGMVAAHERYGTVPFGKLLAPAIKLAREGFPITQIEANRLNKYKNDFLRFNRAPIAFVKDSPWQAGDTLRQPELANTLEWIGKHGKDGFYKGKIAQAIVDEMKATNGIITLDDLAQYKAIWRKPVLGHYRDYQIISMPPPSSGGVTLMQLLETVESFRMDTMAFHSPEAIHLMVEAEKRVYADRATHLGDADFYPVPMEGLLDSVYIHQRMPAIPEKATPASAISAGDLPPEEHKNTTHFSIVDSFGNAVATTTTINSAYGSKVVVQGAGFFMNNEMDDFSAKPGVPNQFGLLGNEANAIEPGKRMLSSMTPTIVAKDGQWWMVLGSPGGSTIITSVFQTIVNVTEFGLAGDKAVAAGRFHHQWRPDTIFVEKGVFSPRVQEALRKKGHHIFERGHIGSVDAIFRTDEGIELVADPRWDDGVD